MSKESNSFISIDGKYLYTIGIIDTLTYFGVKKKVESCVRKTFQGKGVSCIPPNLYRDRFIEFMERNVFTVLKSSSFSSAMKGFETSAHPESKRKILLR